MKKLTKEECLNRAEYLAGRSTHKFYGTGAVIVSNNEIVSEGWAHMSALRLHSTHSMHAEIHALGRCRHLVLHNTGAIIYVVTISMRSGMRTNSCPCITCAVAVRSAGIDRAIFSNGSQHHTSMDLESDLSGLKLYTRRDSESLT